MGGCQNYGPFLVPYYNTAPNIQGTQKGIIILTTTHVRLGDAPVSASLAREDGCPRSSSTPSVTSESSEQLCSLHGPII